MMMMMMMMMKSLEFVFDPFLMVDLRLMRVFRGKKVQV